MARYAVIDKNNNVINVVEWDGITKWSPPESCTVKEHYEVGIKDVWIEDLNDFARPLNVIL